MCKPGFILGSTWEASELISFSLCSSQSFKHMLHNHKNTYHWGLALVYASQETSPFDYVFLSSWKEADTEEVECCLIRVGVFPRKYAKKENHKETGGVCGGIWLAMDFTLDKEGWRGVEESKKVVGTTGCQYWGGWRIGGIGALEDELDRWEVVVGKWVV